MKMKVFCSSWMFGNTCYFFLIKYSIDKRTFAAIGSTNKSYLFVFDEQWFVLFDLPTKEFL